MENEVAENDIKKANSPYLLDKQPGKSACRQIGDEREILVFGISYDSNQISSG